MALGTLGVLAALVGMPAVAAPRVELQVVIDERTPLTGPQEWINRLGQVGVSGLQIRSKQPGDQIGIERGGTESSPVYRVTGALNSNNELVLPGARFALSEAGRVAQWVRDLTRLGPPSERPAKLAFGMSAQKLEQARKTLSPPVGFSTAGQVRVAVLEQIARRLQLPLELGRAQVEALQSDKVEEELSGLSCGTALACVLRPAGLCLVPEEPDDGRLRYRVVRAEPNLEVWPIGWPPDKPEPELLPAMYEFLNVNVQGVPVTEVLKVVGGRLKLPYLMDHNAMARHGIEPDQGTVKLPKSRTTYSLMLRKVLFQAKLKHEVRVDEAGAPFLWISTVKPF